VSEINKICDKLSIKKETKEDIAHLLEILSLLEEVKKRNSSILIKVDGERDANEFTVIIEGGILKDDYIRYESSNFIKCIELALLEYFQNS
jgi:hypothetical protein